MTQRIIVRGLDLGSAAQVAADRTAADASAAAAAASQTAAAGSATSAAASATAAQTARTGAEVARAGAEAARDDAATITGLTGEDAAIANRINTPGSLTDTALSAAIAHHPGLGTTPPYALANTTETAVLAADPKPIEYTSGYLWGCNNSGTLWRSSDDGATWTNYATMPDSQQVQRVLETSDGGHLVVTSKHIYKTTNLLGGAPTFTSKVSANGNAVFARFGISGDGTKWIQTEYGPGTPNFADSRFARVSVDAGETWTQVWDSLALWGSTTNAATHLHGCCYDPWEDMFYIVEGHSTPSGIYRSADNGATWVLDPGLANADQSAPTCVCATDDGLVCTSDDTHAGLYGIPRVGAPADRKLVQTWQWRTGKSSGVLGFGDMAVRDPDTGIVYASFQSSYAQQSPIIAGGTARTGGLVYTWPTPASVVAADEIFTVALGDDGLVLAHALIGGANYYTIKGYRTGHGSVSTSDPGATRGGTAVDSRSTAVGAGATTNTATQALAAGVNSVATQNGVAVGFGATNTQTNAVAVGSGATAGSGAVAIGLNANGALSASVVIGNAAGNTIGGSSVAVGAQSAVVATGVAVGQAAATLGANGVAVGQGAQASASAVGIGQGANAAFSNSVVIGKAAVNVTGGNSVAVGQGTSVAATGVAIGNTAATTAANAVAIGNAASAAASSVAIGNTATTGLSQSVVIGENATNTTGGGSVAVGQASSVQSLGVALGQSAAVAATQGVALGATASVGAGHNGSVAVGYGTATTAAAQVHLGARHLALATVTAPSAPAAGAVRLAVVANGAGQTELLAYFNGGKVATIANQQFGGARLAAYTTAGRPTASSAGAGAEYYDTTLSKPGYSDGATWRDAAGTAI